MLILSPADVGMPPTGMLTATLGHSELEAAACCLVRFHQARQLSDWTPISVGDFLTFMETDDVIKSWARNPFWRPDFFALADAGWVEGWTFDGDKDARMAEVGTLAPKFIAAVSNPRTGPPPHVTLKQIEAVR